MTDAASLATALPLVSNEGALSVNRVWFGHAGRAIATSTKTFRARRQQGAYARDAGFVDMPEWQVWAKPQSNSTLAILLINISPEPRSLALDLKPFGTHFTARDVWSGSTASGTIVDNQYTTRTLPEHDCDFIILQTSGALDLDMFTLDARVTPV